MAFGNSVFVAVSDSTILSSTNGIDWQPRSSGATDRLSFICFGNGVFVISEKNTGTVLTSTDGVTWAISTYYGGYPTGLVVYPMAFGNGRFIIRALILSGANGLSETFISTNGVSWSGVPYTPYARNGAFWFGNGVFTDGYVSSADGVTWTNLTTSGFTGGNSGAYGNGTHVVVGGLGSVLTSADGLHWTNQLRTVTSGTLSAIAYGNSAYIGIGSAIIRSIDGLNYTNLGTNNNSSDIIFAAGEFTVVGSSGFVMQSPDGLTWAQRNSGVVDNLRRVTVGNNLLVAVGDNGKIQTSPTGKVWTGQWSGTDEPLYGVGYGNGTFVAVGYLGSILTSPDAVSWTAQYSGQLTTLRAVTWGAAGFVAVGDSGVLLTSPDGTNWTQQYSGVSVPLTSVCYSNGIYVACGGIYPKNWPTGSAVAITSWDSVDWRSRNTGNVESAYAGSAIINNRVILLGQNGAIVESDSLDSFPLSLQLQPSLNGIAVTVFSPPGSGFRIQGCSDFRTTGWSDLASFSNVLAVTQWTDTAKLPQRFYRVIPQ